MLFDLIDHAIASELGVDTETYIEIIENKCSYEEADFIIDAIWNEREEDIEKAKIIFNNYLNEQFR